jgi:hypothetical protein
MRVRWDKVSDLSYSEYSVMLMQSTYVIMM